MPSPPTRLWQPVLWHARLRGCGGPRGCGGLRRVSSTPACGYGGRCLPARARVAQRRRGSPTRRRGLFARGRLSGPRNDVAVACPRRSRKPDMAALVEFTRAMAGALPAPWPGHPARAGAAPSTCVAGTPARAGAMPGHARSWCTRLRCGSPVSAGARSTVAAMADVRLRW